MTPQSFDANDKPFWCEQGRRAEHEFLLYVAPAYGLKARMNIHKLVDFWVPDLRVNGALADLKAQRTPFFTAGRYGLDPQFGVTLNRNDLERYSELADDLVIYYWVRWDTLSGHFGGRTYHVRPMEGLWRIAVGEIHAQIDDGVITLHRYQTRVDDTRGNARDSYLLDLGRMEHVPLATQEAL
jgi:hypothetical protein